MQDAEASPGPGTPADASAMAALELPEGLELVRVTDRFDARTVPAGLLRAHRVAAGVWGELCVLEGEVGFVFEASGARRVVLEPLQVQDLALVVQPFDRQDVAHPARTGRAAARAAPRRSRSPAGG